MADTLLHNFHSTIADDPNTLLVRPSDWNERHVFNGGSDGNLLVRDVTQFSGFRFDSIANLINGRILGWGSQGETVSPTSLASPTGELNIYTFNKVHNTSAMLLFAQTYLGDSNYPSGDTNGTVYVTIDGTVYYSTPLPGNAVYQLFVSTPSLSLGLHTLSAHFASNTPPILAISAYFLYVEFTVG